MSISIENNDDGSVTVSCGKEKVRVYPAPPTDQDPTVPSWPGPPISLTGVVLPRALLRPRGVPTVPIFDMGLDEKSGEPTFDLPALKEFAGAHKAHSAVYVKIKTPVGHRVDLEALTRRIEGLDDDLAERIVPLLGTDKD